jgi:Spy/CpxP family protein refolding chaperone
MQSARTKGEAGLLVLVVFILGALVGGVGNHLWNAHVMSASAGNGGPGHQPPPPLSQVLGLSADQQKQLDVIFNDSHPQFQALDAQYHAQRGALRKQLRANIRAILTPEQQVKFDEMSKEQDARGRGPNRGPGGPGGPGSGPHPGPGF